MIQTRRGFHATTQGAALLAALAVVLVGACIPPSLPRLGDPGFYVEYRNQTGRDLTLYIVGERDGPPDVGPFRTDTVSGSVWQYPRDDSDPRRVVVFATDDSGVLVYCASFDKAQIRGLNYHIDIVDGTNNCR